MEEETHIPEDGRRYQGMPRGIRGRLISELICEPMVLSPNLAYQIAGRHDSPVEVEGMFVFQSRLNATQKSFVMRAYHDQ